MHKHDTFYKLVDGSIVDPNEVSHDKGGTLRHTSGVAVAMKGDVPHTTGAAPSEQKPKKSDAKAKDVKPSEQKQGYTTRETKAD